MFRHRPTDFDTRVASIAGHLRAVEKELEGIGRSAGRRASARASSAGDQIIDVAGPILNELLQRFGRGQRVAVDQAASFGNDAIERVAVQAKDRPMATLAVAIGVGLLIGFAARRR
jgi:ElaB/YqjD/DUF883 family membrane-anchored ribosome-binding protein